MRDHKHSEYTKAIGIKEEKMDYILNNRGKKSRAGFLNAIIDFYIKHNGKNKV